MAQDGKFGIIVYKADGKIYGSAGSDINANRELLIGPGRGEEIFCVSGDDFAKLKNEMLAEAHRRGIQHVINFGDTAPAATTTTSIGERGIAEVEADGAEGGPIRL